MDLIHSISVLLSTYCTSLGETFTRKVVRETEHQSNTDSSRSVHRFSSRAQQQLFFSYVFLAHNLFPLSLLTVPIFIQTTLSLSLNLSNEMVSLPHSLPPSLRFVRCLRRTCLSRSRTSVQHWPRVSLTSPLPSSLSMSLVYWLPSLRYTYSMFIVQRTLHIPLVTFLQ